MHTFSTQIQQSLSFTIIFFSFGAELVGWLFFIEVPFILQHQKKTSFCFPSEMNISYSFFSYEKQSKWILTSLVVGDSGGKSEEKDLDFSPLVHWGLLFCNENPGIFHKFILVQKCWNLLPNPPQRCWILSSLPSWDSAWNWTRRPSFAAWQTCCRIWKLFSTVASRWK